MNSSLIPFAAIWGVLALVVVGLIAWRKVVARHEDDSLHVLGGGAVQQQAVVSQKLDVIDKWGKILTVIVVVYGLAIGAAYFYQYWVASQSLGV